MPGSDLPQDNPSSQSAYGDGNEDVGSGNMGRPDDAYTDGMNGYDAPPPADPWEGQGQPEQNPDEWMNHSNEDAENAALEQAAEDARQQEAEWRAEEEKGFFDKVMDTMSDVGEGIKSGAKTAAGWVGDGVDKATGFATDVAKGAVGVAVDVADSTGKFAGEVAKEAVGAAGKLATTTLEAASGIADATLKTTSSVAGSALKATSSVAGGLLTGAGTMASSALGAVGNTASGLLGGLFGASSSSTSSTSSSGASKPTSTASTSPTSSGLFGAISTTLNSATTLGKTAFGVVSNVTSSTGQGLQTFASGIQNALVPSSPSSTSGNSTKAKAASKTTNSTTTLGGVLDKSLSTAFSLVGNTVGQAGNVMGGALQGISKVADQAFTKTVGKAKQSSQPQTEGVATSIVKGALNQVQAATDKVRKSGVMTESLNAAKKTIAGGIDLVGDVTDSVVKAASGLTGQTIGEFGKLVGRMTTPVGNKPTPIENYVDMVTKDNPRTANMA